LRAWQTRLLALGLPLLVAADLGPHKESPNSRPADAASRMAGSPALSREDLAILRALPILTEWELLRDWDPEEDLPIPVDAPAPRRGETSP